MTESSTAVSGVVRTSEPSGADSHRISSKEEEVLDVASECFLTHGYDGASINAMARSSGISKESIYRYFGSKKELFEAVIDRELVAYQRKLEDLDTVLETKGLRQALIAIAETALRVVTSDKTLALRRLIFDEATRSPEVGHHYYKIGPERAYSRLCELFIEHLDQAEFDPRTLGRHFIAMLSHSVMLERECRVRGELTAEQISGLANSVVDDFVVAFLRDVDRRAL